MSVNVLYERLIDFPEARLTCLGRDGTTLSKTYKELHSDVTQLQAELRDCGIGSRDVVGLLGENCYEWIVADLALLGLDCVSVALPVDIEKSLSIPELMDRYRLEALLLTRALSTDGVASTASLKERPVRLSKRVIGDRLNLPAAVFSVAFSSGTSGRRKGLLMTKDGVQNAILVSGVAWSVGRQDNILIVMPFAIFQQRYLLYLAIWFGSDVSVIPPEQLFRRLRHLSPTIAVGVPAFFEVVETRVAAEPAWRKLPLLLATIAYAVLPDSTTRLRRALCRRWTAMYGSRPRLLFVGSAPTRPEMVDLCRRMGLPLFEAYGMTEFGWIAFNLPDRCRVGSPGPPVPGIVVRFSNEGEILVSSPSPQSIGYIFEGMDEQDVVYKPHLTIATGDLGRLDEAGFIRLNGRRKNVIITRSGVKISPEEMEAAIDASGLVTKAIVVGDSEGAMLRCVVWMDEWRDPARRREVSATIDNLNKTREPSCYIRDVIFRPSELFTIGSGVLTSNYKVNRSAVLTGLKASEENVSWARA